jgi:hypothetical protein
MNNFLLLQEDDEKAFNNSPQNDRVYSQIESQLSTLRFFGSVLNMYLPVMADTVMNVARGGTIPSTYNSLTSSKGENNEKPSTESLGPDSFDSDPIR